MNYIDTSVIVPALAERHENHSVCLPLLQKNAVTSTHALAEAFAVLTAIFKYPNHVAAKALSDLAELVTVEEISRKDYLKVLSEARTRGIIGGLIYDALHAETARRLHADKVFTYNVSNFKHVAHDLVVTEPQ